jgi:hypothetical protein
MVIMEFEVDSLTGNYGIMRAKVEHRVSDRRNDHTGGPVPGSHRADAIDLFTRCTIIIADCTKC